MQDKKKIIILIDRYLPILGGAQNNVHQVARGLVNEGLNVIVLTRLVFSGLKERELLDGVQVIRSSGNKNRKLSKILFMLRNTVYLIKNRKEYDVVWCVPIGASLDLLPAFFASFLTGKPYVMRTTLVRNYERLLTFSYGSIPDVVKSIFLVPLFWRKVLSSASTIINQSQALSAQGERYGLDSSLIIPNGVDTDKFHPGSKADIEQIRKSLSIPQNKIVIINVSRYVPIKNQITLLKAVKGLIDGGQKDILVLLLGATELGQVTDTREQLVEFSHSSDLDEYVRFIDDAKNVQSYLQASDIFVSTSLNEGMSNSTLEAMACGIPVIAGRLPENICMFPDQYPYYFEATDANELKMLLQELIQSADKRNEAGQLIEMHIQKKFALPVTIDKYKSLFMYF